MNESRETLENKMRLKLSKILNRPLLPPYEVLLTLTDRCNLKCRTCGFSNFPEAASDRLKTADLFSMIDQVIAMGTRNIIFSGGEPLLRADLFEVIRHAVKKGAENTVLLTNGTLVNERIIDEINSSGLKTVCVSIDGLEEAHDYIRGNGAFIKTMDFIRAVRSACTRVALYITTVITDRNLEDIPELLKFYEKQGFAQVAFQPFIKDNTNWQNEQAESPLWVPAQRLPLLDSAVDAIIAFKRSNDIISNDYTFLEMIKHYFRCDDIYNKRKRLSCYEGFRRFTVTSNGKIWICGSEMNDTIPEKGLKECLASEEVKKKRGEMLRCSKPCLQSCAFERENESTSLLLLKWLGACVKDLLERKR